MSALSERSPFLLLHPTQIEKEGWPLEKTAFRILQLALLACAFWWVIDSNELLERLNPKRDIERVEKKYDVWRARWVLGWLPPLMLVWILNPAPAALKWLAALPALVRLIEISATGLGTIFAQAQQVRARNLVTLGFYGIEIAFVFAILYHSFAASAFIPGHGGLAAKDAGDYFYISWSNLTSLGSEYEPTTGAARFLASLTTTFGIFLLSVLLAFGIDAVHDGETGGGRATETEAPRSSHRQRPR
ncbi:MAG: hypothetical protein ACRDLL_08015 [Solirubrobacterales bacterium]